MLKTEYRTEIDGLRALGILGVLAYHLEIFIDEKQLLPGGFLGVDIFFVVSGYLITSLLYEEYKIKGNFSLLNFYFRRAKRLLPALIIVILFTSLLSYFYFFPSEYSYYLKSVTSSLFFVSNIFFHFSGQSYGENIVSEKPLLHTWSLGVEEQFYIFFPLFLLFVLKYFEKYKIFLLSIVIFSSLVFSLKISSTHPSFNFYFLTSRIWELLVGAIIVFWKDKIKFFESLNKNIISLFGLILIFFSFFYFKDVNNHPSFFTIIPVFGCFLILLDKSKNNHINKILSFKILRGLGLISYSLYLWHYPLLVFGKITNFTGIENDDLVLKFLIILIAIILSTITYFFIENIFRKKFEIKAILFFPIIILIYFISIFSLYNVKRLQEKQFPLISKELNNRTWFETKQFLRPCFQRKKYFCSFNSSNQKSIFLIGDSVMASLQNELKKGLTSRDFNFITMTNAGCDFVKISKKINETIFCNNAIYKERLKRIKQNMKSILIIHINYKNQIFKEDYVSQNNFIDDMNMLLSLGQKIIFIDPLPQMDLHTSNLLSEKLSLFKDNYTNFLNNEDNFISINFERFQNKSKHITNLLDQINHKNIYRLNVDAIFCNNRLEGKCLAHDDKNLLFIDNNHLSNFSANLVSQELLKIIDQID